MMVSTQYKVVEVTVLQSSGSGVTSRQIEAELNKYGQEGWGLFSTHERTIERGDGNPPASVRSSIVGSVILIFTKLVKDEIAELRQEMNERFDKVDTSLGNTQQEIDALKDRVKLLENGKRPGHDVGEQSAK